MKTARVRIASSVRTSAINRLNNNGALGHACTLEAMRTQAYSEESLAPACRSAARQAPVNSNRTCFSADRLAVKTATADFMAFSGPPRIALPVLTAAQNSAISFL